MKQILVITTISGFLPQFEQNDVRILQEMGCTIHYASNFENPVYAFDTQSLTEAGIHLHHIDVEKSPTHLRANHRAVKQLLRIIEENQIDIIHCHNPLGGVTGRLAACLSKRKPYVIYTAHGFHFYEGAPAFNWMFFYPVERILAHVTDQLITINREDLERAKRFHLKKGGNVVQIHGVGVDPKRFAPNRQIEKTKRAELGIPENAFHIVTAAELNENKNQGIVIRAISRIAKASGHRVCYTICGKGPMDEKLRLLAKKLGVEQQVRLLGYRTDMEEILQTADCFVFPSYREGLGVAAVEALLCGVPLIAADNRGTREYVQDGINGIVCRADSVQDFANAIELLQQNRELRDSLATVSRDTAVEFTIEEVEKTMRSVYQRAIDSR